MSSAPPRVGIFTTSKPSAASEAAVLATDGCSESVVMMRLDMRRFFASAVPRMARLFASEPEAVNMM